jgi:hypothetical protein
MEELLKKLHTGMCETLLARIESGEATAADLGVARQFLKDNGIDASATQSQPLVNLARTLPFDPEAEREAV